MFLNCKFLFIFYTEILAKTLGNRTKNELLFTFWNVLLQILLYKNRPNQTFRLKSRYADTLFLSSVLSSVFVSR